MNTEGLKIGRLAAIAGGVALVASLAMAQARPAQPAAGAAQTQARQQISALEGLLENAVGFGAQMLTQHMRASNISDMVMLSGMARARGFRLDGYGIVFDVEFPSIRRSVVWSMRALQRPDPELLAAMRELRKNMRPAADAAAMQELDRAIKDLDAQIKAYNAQAGGQQKVAASTTATTPAFADPRSLYVADITNALAEAILDHGGPVGIGADEWLTVAARESADRRFGGDPNDTAMTFILRIKGSDLSALREGRLPREEARKRMEIKQY